MKKAATAVRSVLFSTLILSTMLTAHGEVTKENPTIAIVNDVNIYKSDLETIQKNLQEPWSQYDFESLFPTLQDLAVRLELARQNGVSKKLDESDEFKENLRFTEANILQELALKSYVNEKLTEERLRAYYDEKMKDFTPEEERKTRHILVETREKAEELIKRLDAGEDFNKLATEASIGPSGANGGELGWASKNEFVPEFATAAWALEKGTYSKEPVQTSFGYHIIFVEDVRKTEEPQFEDIKALLKSELQRDLEEQFFEDLQTQANVQRFDVKGEEIATPEAPQEVEPQDEGDVVEEDLTQDNGMVEEAVETVKNTASDAAEAIENTVKDAAKATAEQVSNAAEAGDVAITQGQ
ncbi:MAG: peptidylprolyl isomerase [Alphaproteobacteria bacterium]